MKTSPHPFPLSLTWLATLAVACAALWLLPAPGAAAEQLYTCGMHPQIIKKAPGNCPICGMTLTPIRANGPATASERKITHYQSSMNPGEVSPRPGKDSMGMDLVPVYEGGDPGATTIRIDAATIQRMNLKTAVVTRGPVLREIRTVGAIAYHESGLRDLTLKYEGWIEKLFVNTTWTAVQAGDPLFEIYSPELYNAQLNYLVALRTEGEAGGALTRAALGRLQLLDVPAEFIAGLARTGEASRTVVFRSPIDGMVIEKMAVAGQMMKPGERLYRLADLSSVWALAQVNEQDLPFVRAGQAATVRVTYGPERMIEGRVELLLPQVEEQTRTATARIVLPNADATLRPGMFVDVRFVAQLAADAVLVPDLAVLRSGERNTVFVARDDGTFDPREVRLGARSQGNFYEVLSGLAAGERVVSSGQFMLDSESQLREAIQKMLRSSGDAPATVAPAVTQISAPLSALPPATVGMENSAMLPDSAQALLKDLALATADGAAALAADDFARYQQNLPAMRRALESFVAGYEHAVHGPLAKFRDQLPDRADLKAARRDFAYFSTAVADLVRENHLQHTAGLHIFQCPMAPGIGTGRWLQRTGQLKNPFYGAAMPDCGEEVDAPAGGQGGLAALPPGHPPVAASSAVNDLLALLGPSRVAAIPSKDACGSCGMSEAAMAAGEPCPTDHK